MFTCVYKLSIVIGSDVEGDIKNPLKWSLKIVFKWSTNNINVCPRTMYHNYTVLAGKYV
jgi:hypothetical protein